MSSENEYQNIEQSQPLSQRRRFGKGLFKSRSKNRISPVPVSSPSPVTSPVLMDDQSRKNLFSFSKPMACATTAGAGGFRMTSTRSNSVTDYIEEIKEQRKQKKKEAVVVDYEEQNAMLEQMRKEQAEDSQFSLNPLVCQETDSVFD